MTRYAIDPVILVRLAQDDTDVDRRHQLVAPNSIRSRALDLLLAQVRAGRLSAPAAMKLHERMTEMKLRVLGDRVSRRTAWELASEHGAVSVQDAEYVAVARLQADALVAKDRLLVSLARGVVPLATLKDLRSP